MDASEVFEINQEINQRLAEMSTGDAETRRCRHKDVMELVTKLCVELVNVTDKKPKKEIDLSF